MSDQPPYPSYPGAEPPEQIPSPQPGYQTPSPGYQSPPPGYQSPPPGYGQPYGQAGHGQPGHAGPGQGYGPRPDFASWGSRVGASLLDSLFGLLIAIVPIVAGAIIAFKDAETDPYTDEITGGVEPIGIVILVLGYLLAFVFAIWNQVFRQGRKGQTLGKQIVGIQVVREADGQFLGAGGGFLRALMSWILGGLCLLDYLWPLWDDKKQTWHDKIASSIVIQK
ncbi:MAG: hypothetical protein JWP31_1291 [Aeromicrobium sp.]|nr:hypothetical protein [Aeromicrobium sp.]